MNIETVAVGLGELKSGSRPEQVLVCYGLGSCIGLTLLDPVARVGVMVHVVLPDSSLGRGQLVLPGKFADTAVPAAIAEAVKLGAMRSRLIARMAGGARMLNVVGTGSKLDIGNRNAEAVRVALTEHGLRLMADDTGGTYGRTLHLYMGTGRLLVSTVGRGEREL
ncbi:MAG TPA: chemotaxis protein CheD [Symbiobacteriaceae bacterium]|jgi:chemotaxis protein CheD|nr:chemotaxis protein CheD [Symbiobacteriaceae bacterium]